MAYIIDSLKKVGLRNRKNTSKSGLLNKEDKILIFIIILSAIVIVVDYALIMNFMNVLKNI